MKTILIKIQLNKIIFEKIKLVFQIWEETKVIFSKTYYGLCKYDIKCKGFEKWSAEGKYILQSSADYNRLEGNKLCRGDQYTLFIKNIDTSFACYKKKQQPEISTTYSSNLGHCKLKNTYFNNDEIYINDRKNPIRYLTVKKINNGELVYFTDKIEGIQKNGNTLETKEI